MQPYRFLVARYLMIGLVLPSVFGCMCEPSHPQKMFCNADLVIVGTVQAKQLLPGPPHPAILPGQPTIITYQIQVDGVKKGEEYEGQLWNTQDGELMVNTSASNVSCGVPWLEVGKQYLLTVMVTDGEGSLHICHFHQVYSRLTNMQQRGINGAYSRGCAQHCQIDTCLTHGNCPRTPPDNTTCVHGNSQSHMDCYYHHAQCRLKSSGKCKWKTDFAFGMCLRDRNQIV